MSYIICQRAREAALKCFMKLFQKFLLAIEIQTFNLQKMQKLNLKTYNWALGG